MTKITREESIIDIEQITTQFVGSPDLEDDVYIENCRQPGFSKRYIFDGINWIFSEFVDTNDMLKSTAIKQSCVQKAISLLRDGEIEQASLILTHMIKIKENDKSQSALTPKKYSKYSAFLSKTLKEVAKTHSETSPKDRMRLAMVMWKEHKLSGAT